MAPVHGAVIVHGVKKGRFLLVTHQLSGHAGPELALAKRLVRRGHEVAVHAPAELAEPVAAAGCELIAYERVEAWAPPEGVPFADLIGEVGRHFGSALLADEVKGALERYRPDVAVVDVVVSAAFAATEAEKTRTACVLPILYQPWYHVYGGTLQNSNPARRHLGLRPFAEESPRAVLRSVRLVLVLSSATFDFPAAGRLDRRVKYVGRMVDPDPVAWDSPWADDDPRPLVLVTLSGLFRSQSDQIQRVLDVLGELPVRGLVLIGVTIEMNALRVPQNAVARRWVSHEAVLPTTSVVVTNGGHNTVLAALAHRVPVLVSPLIPEQAWNGSRAEAFGAGLTLTRNATSGEIRAALTDLLADPQIRENAQGAASSLAGDGGERAVDELEGLLKRRWLC